MSIEVRWDAYGRQRREIDVTKEGKRTHEYPGGGGTLI
jgi:hypothetical protein